MLAPLALALPLVQAPEARTVVVALEGLGHAAVTEGIAAGELPNLARLGEQGALVPLLPDAPVDGPSCWSVLNSGRSVAETGVVGFIRRSFVLDRFPIPEKALSEDVQVAPDELPEPPSDEQRAGLPPSFPVVRNLDHGVPYWELAAEQGVAAVVLGTHQAWNRPPVENLRALHRVGVPDARGEYISYVLYTTDPELEARDVRAREADTRSGGKRVRVDLAEGRFASAFPGPDDFVRGGELDREIEALRSRRGRSMDRRKATELDQRLDRLEAERERVGTELPLELELLGADRAAVTLGDERQELALGAWSDWYRLRFDLSGLEVHAITRALLVRIEPQVELYVDALEIDPAHAPLWQPITQPASFARELAEEFGPFSTIGWSYLTHPVKDGLLDVGVLLEDGAATLRQREDQALALMERGDWRLFVVQLQALDRVRHVLGHLADPTHPLHDPTAAARELELFGETVPVGGGAEAALRELDRFVGRLSERVLREGDTLVVFGDFDQASFRRQVHVNNWLREAGYLTVREDAAPGRTSMVHTYVDWQHTRAYSMGLGAVYLNLAGREPEGIVDPDESDRLLDELSAAFLGLRDPAFPEATVALSTYRPAAHRAGPFADLEPDLLLGFAPGYRSSWLSAAGGLELDAVGPAGLFADNDARWSSDHPSLDPASIPGALLCSRPLDLKDGEPARHLHLAPTVLASLGLAAPPEMDAAPLLAAD